MRNNNGADYEYAVTTINNKIFIAIVDLDMGGRSVTNDIENVVTEICRQEGLTPITCAIIYKDSDGIWDGWDAVKHDFIVLRCATKEGAVKKYLSLNLNKN